jgi:MFS family permease
MTAGINMFKIPMILNDLAAGYGMDLKAASWLMAVFTFTGIFCALPAGAVAQKVNPLRFMLAGVYLVACGSLAGAFAPGPAVLIAARALEGVGFCLVTVTGPLVLSRIIAPANRGRAMGLWGVWLCLGQVVSFSLTPVLYRSGGRPLVWLLYAALAALLATVCLLTLRLPAPAATAAGESAAASAAPVAGPAGGGAGSAPSRPGPIAGVLKSSNFWRLGCSYLIYNVLITSVLTFGPAYLESAGVSTARAAILTSMPMLLALVSSPLFGWLMDRLQTKKPLLAFALLGLLGATLFFLPGAVPRWFGILLIGLLACGAPCIVLNLLPDTILNPDGHGGAVGLIMTLQNTGMFLGSLSLSYLLVPAGGDWAAAALMLLPFSFLSLLGVLSLRLPGGKPPAGAAN